MSEPQVSYRLEPLPSLGEDAADEPLADLSAELGIDEGETDYSVRVYQHGARGLAWRFDYTLSDEKPLLERLRDDYGGGVFEVRVIKAGKIAKRHKAIVGAPVEKPKPKAENLSGSDIVGMIREMQQQAIAQFEKIVENIKAQPPAAAPVDPAELEDRMLARMARYKELFMQPPQPKQPDSLEQFLRHEEIRRELGLDNHGGGDDSMTGLISTVARDLIGPIARAAQASQSNGAARPRSQLGHAPAQPTKPAPTNEARPGSPNEPVNNTPAPPPETEKPPMMNELETGLSQLCTFAMLGVQADGAAQSLHDNASDEQWNMLGDIIEKDDFIDRLIDVYAPVAKHRAWFEQLRAALVVMLYQAYAEDGDDDPDKLTASNQPDITTGGDGATANMQGENAADHAGADGDPGENTVR